MAERQSGNMDTGTGTGSTDGTGGTGSKTSNSVRHDPQFKSSNNSVASLIDEVFDGNSVKSAPLRAPPPPSQTAGTLPEQYERVRAARRNFLRAVQLGGVGGYARQSVASYPDGLGCIDVVGDSRQLGCQNVHNLQNRSNFSMSLDPAKLECLACAERHLFLRKDKPVCIVAADHNFSPMLPAHFGTNCVGIIRVEDGTLSEIHSLFRDIFRGYIRPAGTLPPGSIILIGSVSHLAQTGLQQYAEDLTRTLSILGSEVGPGVTTAPYVPVPLGGLVAEDLIRDLMDFDTWLLGSGLGDLQTLPATRDRFWETVGNVSNVVVEGGPRSLFLPASIRNPRKQRFVSGAIYHPATLDPLKEEEEAGIVSCLLKEVSGLLSLKLDLSPAFARGGVSPTSGPTRNRIAFLGASHTQRLSALAASSDDFNSILLPRWAPDESKVVKVVAALENLSLGEDDYMIVDIFSNTAFMGTDERGIPMLPEKGEDGRFHITGSLEVAPQSILKRSMALCSPILAAAKAKVVFMLPVLRYLTSGCCADSEHITNREDADYPMIVASAGESVKRVLEAEITKRGLAATIFSPMAAFDTADNAAATVSSSGLSIWGRADGVHLTETAYRDILTHLVEHIRSTCKEDNTRRRLASIVPVKPASGANTIATIPQTPAWMSGEADMARGRGGWRGRGPRGRGGWRGRRAGWPY